jgi:DNA repair exonuclease SbcCD ATPase subunit
MELYDISVSNFGPYEKFEIPLYKQGLVWLGGINNDTDAADSNGSGKSSVFKAITWGLYGESIDGEKGDGVIREGASKAEVNLRITDSNKNMWTISRSRSKGSPRISLFGPDGKLHEGSKNDIQEKIIRMVGLDFKSFKNTVLYGQNDSSRFANPQTKDSERKSMLHRILNTELLTMCHKKALESAKTVKTDIHVLEEKIERAKSACEEHDVSELEMRCVNYEKEKERRIEARKNNAIAYRNDAAEARKKSKEKLVFPDTDLIEKSIASVLKNINEAEKAGESAKALEGELEKEKKVNTEYTINVASLKKELKTTEEALGRLDGDRCPVCTSPLGEGEASVHINKLKENKKIVENKLEKERNLLNEQEKKLRTIAAKRNVFTEEMRVIPSLHRELSGLKYKLTEAKAEISKIIERQKRLKEDVKSFVEKAKIELVEIQRINEEKNPYAEQLEKARARIEAHNNNIAECEAEIEKKSEILSYYEFWARGFSNQGLPSFILDSVMPYITERANKYLETLSDGDITISFSTQRELKSSKGEMRDEIEIRWVVEGNEMHPPSGGQLKKMEIATDLALMDLVASNEGGSLDMLMLDEVLDGLDAEGCSRVLILLQKLRAIRGSIFVVSHESKMLEVFEKGMCAVKSGGISSLETV